MGRARCIPIAWLLLAIPAVAAAQPSSRPPLPLELDWTAPPECPSSTGIRTELERIARARPGFALRSLSARARIVHRGTLYRATLTTEHEGRRGERLLEAPDCKTLSRSVTLVLALAFGAAVEVETPAQSTAAASPTPNPPTSVAGPASPATQAGNPPQPAAPPAPAAPTHESPPSAAAEEPPPPTAAPEPNEPPLTDTSASPLQLAWSLGAGGTLNLFPSTAWTFTTGPELRIGAFSIALRLLAFPDATSQDHPNLSLHTHGVGGSLQGCGNDALTESLELALCGGARVVSVSARASGADIEPDSAHAPWTALTAAASITWPRTFWLRARLELALAISLGRPRFVIDGTATDHRVPQWVPDLGVAGLAAF